MFMMFCFHSSTEKETSLTILTVLIQVVWVITHIEIAGRFFASGRQFLSSSLNRCIPFLRLLIHGH
jgi:hypothetical protein